MPTPKKMPDFKFKTAFGVDETSAVTTETYLSFLEMHNFRVSEGVDRIEKRDGLTEIVAGTTFSSKDIYCYHTYYDATPAFCQLVVTEDKLWRKVGAGAWTAIHTWSGNITHPVKVFSIQGKQIIITEVENRMILPDGTDVQVGITAPSTAPVVKLEYPTAVEEEDCAGIGDWVQTNGGSGSSSQATFQTKSCFRFQGTGASGDWAKTTKTAGTSPGKRFKVEMSIYFDTFQHASLEQFYFQIFWDTTHIFAFSSDGYLLTVNSATPGRTGAVGIELSEDTWYDLEFDVDTEDSDVDVYIDGTYYGTYPLTLSGSGTDGAMTMYCTGDHVASDVYVDYLNIYNSELTTTAGSTRRYAFTYARSGNYPNESNPLKAIVGTAIHHGAGLNDLTSGGTFTGSTGKTIHVEIDGTGTPDTIKYSYDGGATWHATTVPITSTMYLNYGVTLTWAATTGHTSGDYWVIICQAFSITCAAGEKVEITSIPTSSDSQVDQRKIYSTKAGGASFYERTTINDNTTTTFYEKIADTALGSDMEEDHDVAPNGAYAEWFDDCLWIADADENIVYRSKYNNPEAFDISSRFVSVRRGESDDTITGIKSYKGHLYVLKMESIFLIRKKLSLAYGRYEVTIDFGSIAPWSLIEVYGLLMFVSYRGWEVFNGEQAYTIEFSRPLQKTLKTMDKTALGYITTVHNKKFTEVWLSIPDRTGGASAINCVYHYLKNAFYTFAWHKTASSLNAVRDSGKEWQVVLGTRDGFVYTTDSGNQDGTTNVSAYARLPWRYFKIRQNFRKVDTEFECLTGKSLTMDYYVDFNNTAKSGSRTHAGATPSATDQDLRRPISRVHELDILGEYLSIKYSNSEQIGSDLKINWSRVFHEDRPEGEDIVPD